MQKPETGPCLLSARLLREPYAPPNKTVTWIRIVQALSQVNHGAQYTPYVALMNPSLYGLKATSATAPSFFDRRAHKMVLYILTKLSRGLPRFTRNYRSKKLVIARGQATLQTRSI